METVDELPASLLTDFPSRHWNSIEEQRRLLSFRAKCFTFPVIDVQATVGNVVSKALVYGPDMTEGFQTL